MSAWGQLTFYQMLPRVNSRNVKLNPPLCQVLTCLTYRVSAWPELRPEVCPYAGVSVVSVSSSCIEELQHETSISLHQLWDTFLFISLLFYVFRTCVSSYAILLARAHASWRIHFAGSSLYATGRTFPSTLAYLDCTLFRSSHCTTASYVTWHVQTLPWRVFGNVWISDGNCEVIIAVTMEALCPRVWCRVARQIFMNSREGHVAPSSVWNANRAFLELLITSRLTAKCLHSS